MKKTVKVHFVNGKVTKITPESYEFVVDKLSKGVSNFITFTDEGVTISLDKVTYFEETK